MTAVVIAWSVLSARAAAQTYTWTLRDEIGARVRSAAAYDSARGRVVLAGGLGVAGAQTPIVEWDGLDWEIVPATLPNLQQILTQVGNTVAYDEARRQVVFLTNGSMVLWDGHSLQQYGGVRPAAATSGAMAYDPLRQRVVLFGGGNVNGFAVNETWEWDGANWSRRFPANSPTPRESLAMSWDPVRQQVMIYGGVDNQNQLLAEQWLWDGTNWTQSSSAVMPPANRTRAMAADLRRGRVVLCASTANGLETWEWDGNAWSLVPTAHRPRAQQDISCVYDGTTGRVMVAFGSFSYYGTETWLFDGVDWVLADARPWANSLKTVADTGRGRVVAFDTGFYMPWRTFEWDGARWRVHPTANQPVAINNHDVVYDPVRQRVLLFGGQQTFTTPSLDALWAYDGSDWSQIQRSGAWPSARVFHRLTYDAARDRVVLFGGIDAAGLSSETWLWNGSVWQLATPATSPPARRSQMMEYDQGRQRTVVYGGRGVGNVALTDTWEWDGTNWSSVATPGVTALTSPTSTYDPLLGRIVAVELDRAWTFDGASWTAAAQLPMQASAIAFDPTIGAIVARSDAATMIGRLGPTTSALVQPYGTGCPGTQGEPYLAARGRPHPGNPRFGLELGRACPSSAGLILFGTQSASIPIGSCTLLVNPDLWSWLVLTNASGFGESRTAIPPSPALVGATFMAQCGVLDPAGAAPGGIAGTAGLRIVVGD